MFYFYIIYLQNKKGRWIDIGYYSPIGLNGQPIILFALHVWYEELRVTSFPGKKSLVSKLYYFSLSLAYRLGALRFVFVEL